MMVGTSSANLAIGIAIATAFLTLGALIWQFALYRLSGARLDVRFHAARVDWYGNLMRADPRAVPRSIRSWTNARASISASWSSHCVACGLDHTARHQAWVASSQF
jgi:hypothetical protein